MGLTAVDVRAGQEDARGALLVAERVVTLGHGRHRARALLIRGKRVVWVGDDPEQAPPHRTRIDLPGCTVGPGFVDAHVHLTSTGLGLNGIDLRETTRVDELLRLVRLTAAARSLPCGTAAIPSPVPWAHRATPSGCRARSSATVSSLP